MKKTFLMTGLLLALTAGLASASSGGLNLGWGDCGGLPASGVRAFACNTNTGTTNILVGSFVASSFMTNVTGMAAVLDLQSTAVTLPLWWNLQTGGCRAGSLTSSFDFTGGPFTCFDFFAGSATGGNSYTVGPPNPKQARLKLQCALPAGNVNIGPIVEGTEVYAYKVNINNAKTVNSTCTGCLTDVCIVFNSILVTNSPGDPSGNKFITATAQRNFVSWQHEVVDCAGQTPARNTSWGLIKALYR